MTRAILEARGEKDVDGRPGLGKRVYIQHGSVIGETSLIRQRVTHERRIGVQKCSASR